MLGCGHGYFRNLPLGVTHVYDSSTAQVLRHTAAESDLVGLVHVWKQHPNPTRINSWCITLLKQRITQALTISRFQRARANFFTKTRHWIQS